MEHLKKISQKPQIRPFRVNFSLKTSIKVFLVSFAKMYYEQGCL